jgi:HAD superfamily hydrolase (TIGR01509 family)
MKEVRAVVFDCFGVLYPVAIDIFFEKHKECFGNNNTYLEELNNQVDLDIINNTQFYKKIAEKTGLAEEEIRKEIEGVLRVDRRLIELIKKLKKHYKIGLLSNAGTEEIEIIHKDHIASLFDSITISSRVGSVKPFPEIFNACLSDLNETAAHCLFIDDTERNLTGAKAVGLQTLHYPSFGHIPAELDLLLSS